MKKLVLIDGSSYLYRAFHALPPLTNEFGEPTGALFGVVNMLKSVLAEKPDYVAYVVDASGPTFREALDPTYKANRAPMPDDLRAQVQPLCDIVHALGITIITEPGVEADDVIGTLALRGFAEGLDVTVSTSDKDFAQLVRDPVDGRGVALVNTMSGSRMDSTQRVVEKFGVRPDQIVDFLALMGDSVDNIPGVEKCGPKTAAKWLAEYDTLDGVVANVDAIKGKIGENLRRVLDRESCASCSPATACARRCANWKAATRAPRPPAGAAAAWRRRSRRPRRSTLRCRPRASTRRC